jgi:DNA methylase
MVASLRNWLKSWPGTGSPVRFADCYDLLNQKAQAEEHVAFRMASAAKEDSMTPFYSEGGITIYHGNAEEIAPNLGEFGAVILDPPFSMDMARLREQCELAKYGKLAIALFRSEFVMFGADPLEDHLIVDETLITVACGGHPTVRPLDAMRRIVRLTTGRILDPYMGTGTTLIAAKELGVEAVGIERDETYCHIARERLMAA